MANSLLDFVMSVVRDPDVAAQYAADPAQAIADAHLTDVTTADVNGLIPVVTESLSAAPTAGLDAFGGGGVDTGNVWSSGAATAAFDAFGIDDHLPVQGLDDHLLPQVDAPVISDAGPTTGTADDGLHTLATVEEPVFDAGPVLADVPAPDTADAPVGFDDWDAAGVDDPADHGTDHAPQGFDLF